MDKSVLYQLSYGLYMIGVPKEEGHSGCVVNTVFQVTSEGPDIAVCVNKNNLTCELMKAAGKFSVSVVSEETPAKVIGRFGFFSGRDTDKMAGTDFSVQDGLPLIKEGCCGYLICSITGMQELSTHILFTARIEDAFPGESVAPPMTYAYYHKVIKGKAPKNAPTYQAPTAPASGE